MVDVVHGLDLDRFSVGIIFGESRGGAGLQRTLDDLRHYAQLFPCGNLIRNIDFSHDIAALAFINGVIRSFKPDIVHCHSSKAGILGRLSAKICGVKRVFYTPHAYSFMAPEFSPRKRSLFVFIEKVFSRFATTLTFNVSKGEKQAALDNKLDTTDKFVVIYNGIPDISLPTRAEARQCLGLSVDDLIVGCTARFVEQKNPDESIAIAERVIARKPDAHFVYIGDGPLLPRLRQYVDDQRLSDHIHFLGARSDAERVVTAFDVYLLTSLYEGLPYSLIESIRAGIPVVASDVTGNNEVVTSDCGLLFSGVDEGTTDILQLLQSPIPYDSVRSVYERAFASSHMVKQIEHYYLRNVNSKEMMV